MEAEKKRWSSAFVHIAVALGLLSSVHAQCSKDGFILTGSSGSFSSPNYPSNYPNSKTCNWIISVPKGHLVQLSFQTFILETCFIPSVCSCDHVEIRDGSDENSPSLGRFCGVNKPSPIQSTGRFLWVEFDTDLTRNEKGFNATYTAVAIPVTDPTTIPTAIPVTDPATTPTASVARVNVCSDPKHPTNCSSSLTPICCHDNGPSCCRSGGSRCSDGRVMRDYCPRPSDEPSKEQCCLDDNGRPSCCDRIVCNGLVEVQSRGICIGATAGLVIGGIFILAVIILCLCFLSKKQPGYLCILCIPCVMCFECCDNQEWEDQNCCGNCHSCCKGEVNCDCGKCCDGCCDSGCDCGGCDCGDCDCGGCDCGGCDCGGCDCGGGDCCVM